MRDQTAAGARRRLAGKGRRALQPRHPHRHHDRGALGGDHGRHPGPRGRFFQHRHQRPDPVHPGHRPRQPGSGAPVQPAAIRPCCACSTTSPMSPPKPACKPVFMCGEMAGDPIYVPILLGLGLEELSINPQSIPVVKSIIRLLNRGGGLDFFAQSPRGDHHRRRSNRLIQDSYGGSCPNNSRYPSTATSGEGISRFGQARHIKIDHRKPQGAPRLLPRRAVRGRAWS